QFLGEAKLQEALDAAGIINFRPHSALSDAMSTVQLLQWQQHLLRQIHLPRVSMLPTTTSLLPPIPLLLFPQMASMPARSRNRTLMQQAFWTRNTGSSALVWAGLI